MANFQVTECSQNPTLPNPKIPQELGIQFVDPTYNQVRTLEERLARLAEHFALPTPKVILPRRGILPTPLTDEQKAALNQILMPRYGRFFVLFQDSVRQLPINESGEEMVYVPKIFQEAGVIASFSDQPINPGAGPQWAGKPRVYWARKGFVWDVNIPAGRALNSIGLKPHYEDIFRPKGVQEGLFQTVFDQTRGLHPRWSVERVMQETRSKVANAAWIAGHKGGSAADITLRTLEGEIVDMGNSYLEPGANVIFSFPYLTWDQYANRQTFDFVYGSSKGKIYRGESWHVSDGDTIAAIFLKDPLAYATKYGPIRDFDRVTGEIIPYDPKDYYTPFPVM